MGDHYYTAEPGSASRPAECVVRIVGHDLHFTTDAGVFSRGALDAGSRLLIESAGRIQGRALDLGCGWGAVGVALARINPDAQFVLSDVNRRAVALAQKNIARNGVTNARAVESDGFSALEGAFDMIVSNPPIRAGKAFIYGLFDAARARLNPGGALLVVIRKQQGAPSALKHLTETFGRAEVVGRRGGYWIIRAEAASAGREGS